MTEHYAELFKGHEVNSPKEVFQIMLKILKYDKELTQDQERFWVISKKRSTINHIELVGVGSLKDVHVTPAIIFRVAMWKLSKELVLVHNHGSDNLEPSQEDMQITYNIIQLANIAGIVISDHIIFNLENFFSFGHEKCSIENGKKTFLDVLYNPPLFQEYMGKKYNKIPKIGLTVKNEDIEEIRNLQKKVNQKDKRIKDLEEKIKELKQEKLVYTVKDIIRLTPFSRETIISHIKNGTLKGYKRTNQYIITKENLMNWLNGSTI